MTEPRNDAARLDCLSRNVTERTERAIRAAAERFRRRAENDATILRTLEQQDRAQG